MTEVREHKRTQSFTDLVAWQEGHGLVLGIYKLTKKFPTGEQFGLTNQIRRAAVSITSNIAEGFSRPTSKEKVRFYHIALGSLTEVQNQILIARDIEYCDTVAYVECFERTTQVSKLLNGLIKSAGTRPAHT